MHAGYGLVTPAYKDMEKVAGSVELMQRSNLRHRLPSCRQNSSGRQAPAVWTPARLWRGRRFALRRSLHSQRGDFRSSYPDSVLLEHPALGLEHGCVRESSVRLQGPATR